jgi:hypothetical protein
MITREIGPSSEISELENKRRREVNIGLPQVNRVRGRMRYITTAFDLIEVGTLGYQLEKRGKSQPAEKKGELEVGLNSKRRKGMSYGTMIV